MPENEDNKKNDEGKENTAHSHHKCKCKSNDGQNCGNSTEDKHDCKHQEADKHASAKNHKCKCDEKDNTICELTDTLKRLQAEFENYRKRSEKQNAEFRNYAQGALLEKIIPIVDNFELALLNTQSKDEFVKGVEMIYAQLIDLLRKEGVEQIDAIGKDFSPYEHEALMQEESEKKPGTVIEVFQKGYIFKDRVLRHAKVKIAKEKSVEKT